MGKSVDREDWRGNKYTEHYDDDGNKTGESREWEDWKGDKYTEHTDSDGDKTGESREWEDWKGDKYTEHTDSDGNKTGESREWEDWKGDKYTEHTGSGWHGTTKKSQPPHTGGSSDSASGGFIVFIFGTLGLMLLLSMCTSMCSHQTQNNTPVGQQQVTQKPNRPVKKAKKALKHEQLPVANEASDEAALPPSEKVEEPVRTVREFRVPMNPSIAAANEFTAEVRLPDGRTEPATIAGMTKGSDTLYVTLAQGCPEGTVVTIYPKIEYFNRFVVPANPGILTSPAVNVVVQLPDGRSFQPCVQNIERGMTQLVVTTCDNYPTGSRAIVTPVYGGYRRY